MITICLVILFYLICIAFGFIFLSKITKVSSLLYLAPFSVSFGISSYIFICHIFSFIFGPKKSSIFALFVLVILSLLILLIFKKNHRDKVTSSLHSGISKNQFNTIFLLSMIISVCTFLCIYRYGLFDDAWHLPLALSIYHNDVYPPRDVFRPDYVLAYHFGGDLLGGAINHISKLNIFTSFQITSGIMSGVTFFSYFILAWILTSNFQLSLISAFCSFFGAGFMFFNAVFNHTHGNFLENLLVKSIHGSITDAPFMVSFSSTASIGYPVLILCLFLFYQLLQKKGFKTSLPVIISIVIPLFSLSLFASWLSMTFLASIFVYWTIFLIFKKKEFLSESIKILTLLVLFFLLNKIIGNQMYAADQFLGRANIFNFAFKEHPFTIFAWSGLEEGESFTKIVSCFSFEFVSAFGLSLILLPVIFFYLKRYKDDFSFLLFLCAALTMPLTLILDFKLNPVDFNRLLGFGNTMLILLITCGLGLMFRFFLQKKIITLFYLILLCISPFSGFVIGTIFSPRIYLDKQFAKDTISEFKKVHSLRDFINFYIETNKNSVKIKNAFLNKYKSEIAFFSNHTRPKDVVISSIPNIPAFGGAYTLVPAMLYGLYSNFDNIYPTIISTLDPHLLNELNVKWVAYDALSKQSLLNETKMFLNNDEVFMLIYKELIKPEPDKKILYEIYHIGDLSKYLKPGRKTGWILVNKNGFPIEILEHLNPNISVFSFEKDALQYLKQLYNSTPKLKKELITAQPIIIKTTEEQLSQAGLQTMLEKKF